MTPGGTVHGFMDGRLRCWVVSIPSWRHMPFKLAHKAWAHLVRSLFMSAWIFQCIGGGAAIPVEACIHEFDCNPCSETRTQKQAGTGRQTA